MWLTSAVPTILSLGGKQILDLQPGAHGWVWPHLSPLYLWDVCLLKKSQKESAQLPCIEQTCVCMQLHVSLEFPV